MSVLDDIKAILIIGPIATMLALGFWMTLRSGLVGVGGDEALRRVAGNLSQTVLLIAACLVGLLIVQQVVGYSPGLIRH